MEVPLWLAVAGAVLVVAVVLGGRTTGAKRSVPTPVGLTIVGAALAAGVGYVVWSWPDTAPRKFEHPAPRIPGISPLAAGHDLPRLDAAGWLHGPPPSVGPGGPRVIVV